MYTGGSERLRIDTSGNLLLGTTTGFSTTTNAGNMVIAGLGMYPYTTNTGSTNTVGFSSLNIENLTTFIGNNGATTQGYDGITSSPKGSNTGAGGTSFVTVRGGNFLPTIQSSSSAARVAIFGINSTAQRGNANDTSTASNNNIIGVIATAAHATTAGAGILTGTGVGLQAQSSNVNGTMTAMHGVRSLISLANATTSLSASSTNAYGFSSELSIGSTSGGGGTATNLFGYRNSLAISTTGTVTNFYGLFLGTPSVAGTLTNRWGIYQEDTAGTNLLAAPTKISNGYTVATLPTGAAAAVGMKAYVTDALSPVFLTAVVGGGAVVTPVFHNGTTWVAG
jgi:hypothetical protein